MEFLGSVWLGRAAAVAADHRIARLGASGLGMETGRQPDQGALGAAAAIASGILFPHGMPLPAAMRARHIDSKLIPPTHGDGCISALCRTGKLSRYGGSSI